MVNLNHSLGSKGRIIGRSMTKIQGRIIDQDYKCYNNRSFGKKEYIELPLVNGMSLTAKNGRDMKCN